MSKTERKTTRAKRGAKPSTAIAVVDPQKQQLARAADVAPPASGAVTIVEKLLELARDPGVDVVKINALIDANERVIAIGAKQQFDEAFAAMQAELPVITKHGLATVTAKDNPDKIVRRTPYARDVDITIAVRPILAKYGFALRHRNAIADGKLTVTGILSHRAGHREEDTFGPVQADDSGRKNPMQAWASGRSYGKRYTTIALLNISSEDPLDGDDDGERAGDLTDDVDPRRGPQPGSSTRPAGQARASTPSDDLPITNGSKQRPGQRQRLWVILRNSGRNEQAFRDWLHDEYGYTSTKDIRRKHYDAICRAIEADGPLPRSRREPGEEG